MFNGFIISFREGFEIFLIASITLTYLRKSSRSWLAPAVYWSMGFSLLLSAALGYLIWENVNQPLWEGILGLVAIALILTLLVHMRKAAPHMKDTIQRRVDVAAVGKSRMAAFAGVFMFTMLMTVREGMETALLMVQVRDSSFIGGMLLGLVATGILAVAWTRLGHLINIRRFFQITGIFLVLFMCLVAVYSFHEFSEVRPALFANAEHWHELTEPFSPDGMYGKWFAMGLVLLCGGWLTTAWIVDRVRLNGRNATAPVGR